MASFNQVQLIGNIGNIQTKTFANGGKVVEASLATGKRWTDRNGTQHEETQWHHLVIGVPQQADLAEKYIAKGDPLFVQGELTYRKYQDRSGQDREVAEVRVSTLQLLTKREGSQQQPTRPAPQAQPENPHLAEMMDNGDNDLPF